MVLKEGRSYASEEASSCAMEDVQFQVAPTCLKYNVNKGEANPGFACLAAGAYCVLLI